MYSHLSLILNKLGSLDTGKEALSLLTETYRGKALDTFIRGLNGDLPRLLGMREPADLPQALHLCLKLENQKFRTHYAQNQNDLPLRKQSYYSPPPLPQRGPNNQRQRQTFYPQLAHVPRFQINPRFFNYEQVPTNSNQPRQPPPRPIAPKPLPPPEPMDIDRSIRS